MSDLISRSELLKHCHRVTEYDEAGFSMEYNAVSVEDIKNAPTVEAKKVVHGEWINCDDDIEDWYRCSECENDNMSPSNFCPNCGTKMKELNNE